MNIPPYGDELNRKMLHFGNLKVTAQNTPNMTVKVSAGGFWYYTSTGSSYIEFSGGNSESFTPPPENYKWVIVTLTSAGFIELINGPDSASPVIPSITRGRIPLAGVYLADDTTVITNDRIFDMRLFERSITDHRDLLSINSTGAHLASAISFDPLLSGLVSTNSQDAIIELKVLIDDLYSRLP